MEFSDDKEDFFDREIDAPKPEEKKPVYKPDDPRYWEEPESEFEHLKPLDPRQRRMWWVWLAAALCIAAIAAVIYFHWFSPYVEESIQYGYVENIERRGDIFKTYEGVLIPYKEIMDTTRLYRQDFLFTARPEVAVMLRKMQFANLPVKVTYEKYHATLPWRGDSRIVVTRVDSIDPKLILPPEFQPDINK